MATPFFVFNVAGSFNYESAISGKYRNLSEVRGTGGMVDFGSGIRHNYGTWKSYRHRCKRMTHCVKKHSEKGFKRLRIGGKKKKVVGVAGRIH